MNMYRRSAVALGAIAVALVGCAGKTGHKSNEKYYLICANVKLPYWQAAASGLYRAAKDLDVTAEATGPDTYDPQAEQTAFQAAVAKKPAGLLVSAADPNLMKGDINAAIDKGIPVITIDSDTPDSKRLVFIGTNNRQAGLMGARRAVKELNGRGNVLVYTIPGQANLEERLHGYKDVFGENPGIKIVDTIDMKGDPRVAFDRTSDILDKGKLKPDAFVCLEAISCKEVADVLDRKKISGKVIVAMDTDQGTMDWIKKGVIAATIAQKPFTMAYYGLKMLGDLALNKPATLDRNWAQDAQSPLPGFIDTGATLIDKSNVDAFLTARDSANSR
ncbi:MAG: substrate-binding domain-containing protein [Acidobacteriota bacterium]|nr:substrate-binding domain-containing protein [Acidobacteriota bacterium]